MERTLARRTRAQSLAVLAFVISLALLSPPAFGVPGGAAPDAQAAPTASSWSFTGDMATTTRNLTVLSDGTVLTVHGATAERYDPATGTWSPTGPRTTGGGVPTLLADGRVLVSGGGDGRDAERYNPATNTWTATGRLTVAHTFHTATLLGDGKVLVVGARSSPARAELYNPASGTWSATAAPSQFYEGRPAAALLPDGDVLYVGGDGSDFPASAELYHPATATWSPAPATPLFVLDATAIVLPGGTVLVLGEMFGNANAATYDPVDETWTPAATGLDVGTAATLLRSGEVLLSGGGNDVSTENASIYDPATDTTRPTASMRERRTDHAQVLLADGRVLVAGGFRGNGCCSDELASAELYTTVRVRGTWARTTGDMVDGHGDHTATLLANGRVLVAGGGGAGTVNTEVYDHGTGRWTGTDDLGAARQDHTATLVGNGNVLVAGGGFQATVRTSAEIYAPATGQWSGTGAMAVARRDHTATLLPNGRVLVAGGNHIGAVLDSAELFDPATGTWSPTGSMDVARTGHTSTLLGTGKVLVAGGGDDAAELYDPASGTWSPTGAMVEDHGYHTATLLVDGRVLVAGGGGTDAEVYRPGSGTWAAVDSMSTPRFGHTATRLRSGLVLVAGGSCCNIIGAELFDPATGRWRSTGDLTVGREFHTAILLTDGRVLAAGGGGPTSELYTVHDQLTPAAAWNGTNYLVVWSDLRSGSADIYAARVSPSGTVLDVGGRLVSAAAGDQTEPDVTWNGANFLVAWTDARSGPATDVYGARVSPGGTVLDPSGRVVSAAAGSQHSPALASSGGAFQAVWADRRSGSADIFGTRVSGGGAAVTPGGQALSTATGDQLAPDVAWGASSFLAAWHDRRAGGADIFATRVDTAGAPLDPSGIALSSAAGDQSSPALAWNGTAWLAAWADHRSATLDVRATRVSTAGAVLDPSGIRVSTGAGDQSSPAATAIGSTFLVAWRDEADIAAIRVAGAGTVVGPRRVLSGAPGPQQFPALASSGSAALAAWQDRRAVSTFDLFASRVSDQGTALDPAGIPFSSK